MIFYDLYKYLCFIEKSIILYTIKVNIEYMDLFDNSPEYKAVTISRDRYKFVQEHNIKLSPLMAQAIDREMCKVVIYLDMDCMKWIEESDINFDLFVRTAIYNEMNGNGKKE